MKPTGADPHEISIKVPAHFTIPPLQLPKVALNETEQDIPTSPLKRKLRPMSPGRRGLKSPPPPKLDIASIPQKVFDTPVTAPVSTPAPPPVPVQVTSPVPHIPIPVPVIHHKKQKKTKASDKEKKKVHEVVQVQTQAELYVPPSPRDILPPPSRTEELQTAQAVPAPLREPTPASPRVNSPSPREFIPPSPRDSPRKTIFTTPKGSPGTS